MPDFDVHKMAHKPDPLPRETIKLGELIGHRIWEIHKLNDEYTVRSWVYPCFWLPGQIISDLSYKDENGCVDCGPINDYNERGIWAFKTSEYRDQEFNRNWIYAANLVWGTCWMWGTIIEHRLGWRSQYARIRTIDSVCEGLPTSIEWLRNKYGVA